MTCYGLLVTSSIAAAPSNSPWSPSGSLQGMPAPGAVAVMAAVLLIAGVALLMWRRKQDHT